MQNQANRVFQERYPISFSFLLESIWRDFRVSLRGLVTKPGFTFLVVLSLGLGIGANTVIFSVIDGILLRPVAIPHAEDPRTTDRFHSIS